MVEQAKRLQALAALSAVRTIGYCNGNRAIVPNVNHTEVFELRSALRDICRLAGNTPTNKAAESNPPTRRDFEFISNAAHPSSTTPEA